MNTTSDALQLPSPSSGLTAEEARSRLTAVGPNEIKRGEATSPWKLLAGQFASPLIWLLLAAAPSRLAFSETS
jgi:magnesium-transporting ATPase (P-type)